MSRNIKSLYLVATRFTYIDTTHADTVYFVSSTKVKHSQRNDTSSFVAISSSTTDISCCVFSSSHHQHVHFVLRHFQASVLIDDVSTLFRTGEPIVGILVVPKLRQWIVSDQTCVLLIEGRVSKYSTVIGRTGKTEQEVLKISWVDE